MTNDDLTKKSPRVATDDWGEAFKHINARFDRLEEKLDRTIDELRADTAAIETHIQVQERRLWWVVSIFTAVVIVPEVLLLIIAVIKLWH